MRGIGDGRIDPVRHDREVAGVGEEGRGIRALPFREEDDAVEALEAREHRAPRRAHARVGPARAVDPGVEVGVVHHVQRDEVRASVLGHEVRDGLAVGEGERPFGADQAVEPVGVELPRAGPLAHGLTRFVEGGHQPGRTRRPPALVEHGQRAVGTAVLERDPTTAPLRHEQRRAVAGLGDVDGVGLDMPRSEYDAAGLRAGGSQVLVGVPQADAAHQLTRLREAFAHLAVFPGEGRT